jgi:hypothetical protein
MSQRICEKTYEGSIEKESTRPSDFEIRLASGAQKESLKV